MTIICVQCSMRALADGQPSPTFEGTMQDHLRQYHPDPIKTKLERVELERRLADKMKEED